LPIGAETFFVDAHDPRRRLGIIGARSQPLKCVEDKVAKVVQRPGLNNSPGKNENRSGDDREKVGATPLQHLHLA
jgi:hypothetical protein